MTSDSAKRPKMPNVQKQRVFRIEQKTLHLLSTASDNTVSTDEHLNNW